MKSSLFLCAALLFSGVASASTYEQDVAQYTQIFNSNTYNVEAIESLAWMGISDPAVFDPIAHHLTDDADRNAILSGSHASDVLGHYVRALGFSGNAKYIPVLNSLTSDPKMGRYAKTALEDMASYQKWNPIISNRASFDARYSDDVNRVLNMLRSNDFSLKRIGAKRVYFANQDEVLLETLATEIEATYMKADASNEDQIAWMVKALGNAKHPKYKDFLEEIAQHATDKEVIKYAQRALEIGFGEKVSAPTRY